MSLANHAGRAEYQLPARPSITEQPLSHLHPQSSEHLLSSAAQTNALTCEGGRGTCSLLALRYKAGNLWLRVKWINHSEQAVILSEGVNQVAGGKYAIKIDQRRIVKSQLPGPQISDLQELPDTHAEDHLSCCMSIQIDLGAQHIAKHCRIRGER